MRPANEPLLCSLSLIFKGRRFWGRLNILTRVTARREDFQKSMKAITNKDECLPENICYCGTFILYMKTKDVNVKANIAYTLLATNTLL